MTEEQKEKISKGIKYLWEMQPSKYTPAVFAFQTRFLSLLDVAIFGKNTVTHKLPEIVGPEEKPHFTPTGLDDISLEKVKDIFEGK